MSVVGSKVDMDYYQDIQPWVMDNLPVSVKEDNDHLGLIVSGYKEEEKNIDLKMKKSKGCTLQITWTCLFLKMPSKPSSTTSFISNLCLSNC